MAYYSWLVHGYLCDRPLVRSPGVTSNPCLDFSPFHVAKSSFEYPQNEVLMEREGEGVLSSAEAPAGYPPYGTKRPLRRKEGKGGNERMIDLRLISNTINISSYQR